MLYRCDRAKAQDDGALIWYADWMGGPSISKIANCRLVNIAGDMRRTVVITGEADTYFSVPAECRIMGCHVRGYVTSDDGNLVFRQVYY
jgi:hypothetical protein